MNRMIMMVQILRASGSMRRLEESRRLVKAVRRDFELTLYFITHYRAFRLGERRISRLQTQAKAKVYGRRAAPAR